MGIQTTEDLIAVLEKISFAPSCVNMAWEWVTVELCGVIRAGDGGAPVGLVESSEVRTEPIPEAQVTIGTEDPIFIQPGTIAPGDLEMPPGVVTTVPVAVLAQKLLGWTIATTFQRPDTDTGEIGRGKGRPWFIAVGSSESSVVKTAWLACKQIVEHELMEAFLFEGVRPFDPHAEIRDLTSMHESRRPAPKLTGAQARWKRWFDIGKVKPDNPKFMLVVRDTAKPETYPVYCQTAQGARNLVAQYQETETTYVLGIYNITDTWENQSGEDVCRLPPAVTDQEALECLPQGFCPSCKAPGALCDDLSDGSTVQGSCIDVVNCGWDQLFTGDIAGRLMEPF